MAQSKNEAQAPDGYVPIKGSERKASPGSRNLGPADPNEEFSVLIVLRRRADGPPPPDLDYYSKTPRRLRQQISREEFEAKYGAHPDEIKKVVKFAHDAGLKVEETHLARRTVRVSGTVAKMSKAFGVTLSKYERSRQSHHSKVKRMVKEVYRGREGHVYIPANLADCIIGVFGLDNRSVAKRANNPDPPYTIPLSVQTFTKFYNFPANMATGETIAVCSVGGYFQSDMQQYFGASLPTITPFSADGVSNNGSLELPTNAISPANTNVLHFASTAGLSVGMGLAPSNSGIPDWDEGIQSINAATGQVTIGSWNQGSFNYSNPFTFPAQIPSNTKIYFNPDGETTQDIQISASAAPGANVAVYFINGSQVSWIDMATKLAHPGVGDPECAVLTSSWYITNGDDASALTQSGLTSAFLTGITPYFQDAAMFDRTICFCTGDYGSGGSIGDGKAHVAYPASDPWLTAVGGTTVGSNTVGGQPNVEYVWNDPASGPGIQWGTGGGGVSALYPSPQYQLNRGIKPVSINDGTSTGRATPDVSANASYNSGYLGIFFGQTNVGNGTSGSTPLWSGLITVINAALGVHIGYINPDIYQFAPAGFNDINPAIVGGPTDNSNSGVSGYNAGAGWDPCTGWGSPNGVALMNAFQALSTPTVYINGGYQSPDVILTDLVTTKPVPIGGLPTSTAWDTQLPPNTQYGFSATIHNDTPTAANGVEVDFWAIPGGWGINGTWLAKVSNVSVPAFGSTTVNSPVNFTSAAAGGHLCAVVSLYNPTTGCSVNTGTNAQLITDPGNVVGAHRCSAWRNTDSMAAGPGGAFKFKLGTGIIKLMPEVPLIINVLPIHIPFNWKELAPVKELSNVLNFAGAESSIPLYLLPQLSHLFAPVNIKPKITKGHGGKIEEIKPGIFKFFPHEKTEEATFEFSGEVPANAKIGDIIVVRTTAHYPRMEKRDARTVEFYVYVHVMEKRERK